ncbi:histidine phosphatase family protein [Anaerocolumna sedimenticola]|uniref:Histidine phosphatase family protein n=1 Tax=Anaerocolumna sedimenticola TaxID=2696063 RepID=A0A6P1TGC2_9FIRM|nr:histidine phosphatase family protein [Anaerocolumna sedimenticola]QHQ59463.1 histidine phosphatase family protein [Anaerocolumna sedimenticola]
MTTEIYLVRHGETDWNKEGKFQGCTDINLSKEGTQQAHLLKEVFNNNFDYIYTSPLSRAVQTAEILCENHKEINPVIVPDLREINFGAWEGLTIKQIREQYPAEYQAWRTDEEYANLIGGDLTLRNASNRAKDAILKLADKHTGKKTVFVAHGGILKAALIGIFDWKMTMYHRFFLGNTSVTKISIGNSQVPILIKLNDTSHLPDEYYPA